MPPRRRLQHARRRRGLPAKRRRGPRRTLAAILGRRKGYDAARAPVDLADDRLTVSVRTSSFATLNLPALHLSFFPSSDLTSSQADDAVALDQAASSVFQPKRVERWLSELPERRRRVRRRGTLKFENEWIEEEPDDKGEGPSGRPGMDEEAPWYAALREQLLLSQNHRPLAPFDSTSHPVACVIAVSTSNPEPLNGFAQLYDSSSRDGSGWRGAGEGLKERSWMDCGGPGVLRYYVVVHEGADETGRKECVVFTAPRLVS